MTPISAIYSRHLLTAAIVGMLSIGCSGETTAPPEPPEARITRAIESTGLRVTTRDSLLYTVSGVLDNSLFRANRPHLVSLDSLHAMSVNFKGAPFTDLASLADLPHIERLDFSGNDSLKSLSTLPDLARLKSLTLNSASSFTSLSGLPVTPTLVTINISDTPKLQDLSALSTVPNLRSLDLSYNSRITNLDHLPSLTNLETLDLSYCAAFSALNSLPELPALRTIRLYNTAVTQAALAAFSKERPGITIDK
ncbi:MAG: hypothetical protein HOH43_02575 [Candidatus Latescibacteria bacterium]|nr:hypothetical protein [Candidatus Latescibacterota bacterium]